MGLLFRFYICPVRNRFERSPLPPLPAPLPAPLSPPLTYVDFTGIGLTYNMFIDAFGCIELNQLVRFMFGLKSAVRLFQLESAGRFYRSLE